MKLPTACLLILTVLSACKRTEKVPPGGEASPAQPAVTIEPAHVYAPVQPDKVTRLDIRVPGEKPVALARKADGWHMLAPHVDRADQRAVQFALGELFKLAWDDRPLTKSKAEWSVHGFDPATAATVIVTEGDKARPALILGTKKTARVGARHDVYRIHNLSYYTFARELRFWRNRTITRFTPDQVRQLEIVDATGRLVLSRKPPPAPAKGEAAGPGTWTVEAGGKANLDRAEMVYRRILDLEAADIATVSIAEAGLTKPRLTLTAKTANGSTSIAFGNEPPAGGAYVRIDQSERVLVLGKSAARALGAPVASWR